MDETTTSAGDDSCFSRSLMALGEGPMEALAKARVIIFGIGGVGSWAAEALVRTGLRHITLVDADCVADSNINRQAPATVSTVGEPKVEAMRRILLDINPRAEVDVRQEIYCEETADRFDLAAFDYVIDAIDSLKDKALLIRRATAVKGLKLFSSMGAALKMDPGKIAVAEFWTVTGCPLGAALRSRFRRSGEFPAGKFLCVYSPERIPNHPIGQKPEHESIASESHAPMQFGKVSVNGSLCHITATFGMRLAGLVIQDIYAKF